MVERLIWEVRSVFSFAEPKLPKADEYVHGLPVKRFDFGLIVTISVSC